MKDTQKNIARLLRSLAASISFMEIEVETFTPPPACDLLRKNGMEAEAELIEIPARKEWEKVNGDSEKQAKAQLVSALTDGFKTILDENSLNRAPRRQRGEVVTAANITAEQTTKALAARKGGRQLSVLAEELGTSYANLRLAILRDHGENALASAREGGVE
jgi:hypothetical protein